MITLTKKGYEEMSKSASIRSSETLNDEGN